MMPGKHFRNTLISSGLIVTLLFTALALPIVSSASEETEATAYALKSADDLSKQNAQLPLAEKESEEEESLNEKDQNLSFVFIPRSIQQSLTLNPPIRRASTFLRHIIFSEVPLYLTKRTLLI